MMQRMIQAKDDGRGVGAKAPLLHTTKQLSDCRFLFVRQDDDTQSRFSELFISGLQGRHKKIDQAVSYNQMNALDEPGVALIRGLAQSADVVVLMFYHRYRERLDGLIKTLKTENPKLYVVVVSASYSDSPHVDLEVGKGELASVGNEPTLQAKLTRMLSEDPKSLNP